MDVSPSTNGDFFSALNGIEWVVYGDVRVSIVMGDPHNEWFIIRENPI